MKIDVDDTGRVNVASSRRGRAGESDPDDLSDIIFVRAKLGKTYLGKVVRLAESLGAFVEIFLGTDGLLHVSGNRGASREGREVVELREA